MSDQYKKAQRSEESIANLKTSGGWEKTPRAELRANTQALLPEENSEAIQRWIQESKDVAPWNAIESFGPTALAKKGDAGEGETSTNGATAGSKTSVSRK